MRKNHRKDRIEFCNPVWPLFPGDTIWVETENAGMRAMSKPKRQSKLLEFAKRASGYATIVPDDLLKWDDDHCT